MTNPMLFHLESLWGATIRGCAMDCEGTK